MLRLILFSLLFSNLFALEISINSAKEDFQKYSILHLKSQDYFVCQEIKNDFKITTKIICAFSKQPVQPLKTIQNDFFKINTRIKDKTFFIVIKPFYKITLIPIVFNLTKDNSTYKANVKLSKHWMILGFHDKTPLINTQKKSEKGINFPFYLDKDKFPFVGALDIRGNPVHLNKVEDVTQYLKIKKDFKAKKYELALNGIDETLSKYPNSLFKAELLFYKLKVYSKLKDYDNVISLSKEYLQEYSSNENIPEVLALTARAYAKNGSTSDADYFFDRLFSEHADSVYAKWGYIYKADMLYESGGLKKALMYYDKALTETKSIDVAVVAAYKIAQSDLEYSKEKDASKYIMKIINAKPSFFIENLKSSLKTIQGFVDAQDYITASAIAKALLDRMNKKDDNYELLLKNRGLWLAKTPHKKEALKALNAYLKTYKYGDYQDEVQTVKDSLFFDTNDDNSSVKLKKYNKLISDYRGDSIGNRAIYEKAKLLLSKGMYSDILGFKDSILALDSDKYRDTKQIIQKAAIGVMEFALKHKECQQVLNISNDYNITLSDSWDDGIYECAMKGGDYILAKKTAGKNLESTNIDFRKKWLFRYIKIDFATSNYTDVIDASKELISLIEDNPKSPYKDVYRILFDAYMRVGKKDEAIKIINKIQKLFGLSYKDVERYVSVMGIGSSLKDDNMVIKYGNDVMKIQSSSNSHDQSPYVEFTLYQAYVNRENFQKALEVIKSLDSVKLNKNDRARQKYLLGSAYSRLWRDEKAKKAYKESIKADSKSAWAKLAQDALKTF